MLGQAAVFAEKFELGVRPVEALFEVVSGSQFVGVEVFDPLVFRFIFDGEQRLLHLADR